MSTRRLFLTLLPLLPLLVLPGRGTPQPLLPQHYEEYGNNTGMRLYLPTEFLPSLLEDRLHFARMRQYDDGYRRAAGQGLYEQALAFTDSLIRTSERHPMPGVRFTECYKNRALMFRRLNRNADACAAYARAVKVQDSLMRLEQSEVIREMQASYELDRLALDNALLRATHHKTALIAVALLLLVLAAVVGAIYIGNRRTRQLRRKLLLETKHAYESELKKVSFINSICHEVRTPLNCISGFSELLTAEETTPEAHAQYCEIIQENRRQLRYLFDDMLEVAFLENLDEPLPRSREELCDLCRRQLRILKVKYPKPSIVYKGLIPYSEIDLRTNGKYLSMLIAVLLGNAYKFTQKGTVCLECGHVDDERVFIAVSDTGCGIPPEKHAYVFERFTKIDSFSQGNGLGLYLCRLIARHLEGEIRIDPAYTGGTRIVATFPRR